MVISLSDMISSLPPCGADADPHRTSPSVWLLPAFGFGAELKWSKAVVSGSGCCFLRLRIPGQGALGDFECYRKPARVSYLLCKLFGS